MSTIKKIQNQILEILSYLWIAALATVVNFVIATVSRERFGVEFNASIAVGYASGMVVGFILSKLYSFKHRTSRSTKSESIKFGLVTLAAYSVTTVVALICRSSITNLFSIYPTVHYKVLEINKLTQQRWINRDSASHIMGIGVGFFVNFFGHKFLTFRKTDAINRIRRRVTV